MQRSLLFLHVRLCDCEREKGGGIKKGKVGGVGRTEPGIMWGQHGAVLCIVGCLAAFLAYLHLMPINIPWVMTENVSRHYRTSSGSREKAKLGLVENHCLNPTLQGGARSDQQVAVLGESRSC